MQASILEVVIKNMVDIIDTTRETISPFFKVVKFTNIYFDQFEILMMFLVSYELKRDFNLLLKIQGCLKEASNALNEVFPEVGC